MTSGTVRTAAARGWARVKLELPVLVRDLAGDLLDRLGRRVVHLPIPPRRLRAAVGLTSAREEYLQAGAVGAIEILAAFHRFSDRSRSYPRWLDFGAGTGRLSRYFAISRLCDQLVGADVDEEAAAWTARHLPSMRFVVCGPRPPLRVRDASADVIVAASVFTHFDEESQLEWIAELARVLAPGGLLLASTHPAALLARRPDATAGQHEELRRRGFSFVPGRGRFNEGAAFHSREYLEATWTRSLVPLGFVERGLFQSQDLSVWRKS